MMLRALPGATCAGSPVGDEGWVQEAVLQGWYQEKPHPLNQSRATSYDSTLAKHPPRFGEGIVARVLSS